MRSRSGSRAADQREQPERERGVGGHRRAPAARRRPPGVEGQVDGDRHEHPAQPGQQRQHQPAPFAQVAQVELAPGLQPDDEEEERHQAAVDPVAQVCDMPAPPSWIDSGVSHTAS